MKSSLYHNTIIVFGLFELAGAAPAETATYFGTHSGQVDPEYNKELMIIPVICTIYAPVCLQNGIFQLQLRESYNCQVGYHYAGDNELVPNNYYIAIRVGAGCPCNGRSDCVTAYSPCKEGSACVGGGCPDNEVSGCAGSGCPDSGGSGCAGVGCPDSGGSGCVLAGCPDSGTSLCVILGCPDSGGSGYVGAGCSDSGTSGCFGAGCPDSGGRSGCVGAGCPTNEGK